MEDENKLALAERLVDSWNQYANFRNDFIDAFKLNSVQFMALNHLCGLVAEHEKIAAQVYREGFTFAELYRIFNDVIRPSRSEEI